MYEIVALLIVVSCLARPFTPVFLNTWFLGGSRQSDCLSELFSCVIFMFHRFIDFLRAASFFPCWLEKFGLVTRLVVTFENMLGHLSLKRWKLQKLSLKSPPVGFASFLDYVIEPDFQSWWSFLNQFFINDYFSELIVDFETLYVFQFYHHEMFTLYFFEISCHLYQKRLFTHSQPPTLFVLTYDTHERYTL